MRDKVMGKINVSYEGLISSRATGEAARNGRYQDDSSRSGITPGLIEFISLDDDPSGISDVQAIRKHPVSAAGQATMRQRKPVRIQVNRIQPDLDVRRDQSRDAWRRATEM